MHTYTFTLGIKHFIVAGAVKRRGLKCYRGGDKTLQFLLRLSEEFTEITAYNNTLRDEPRPHKFVGPTLVAPIRFKLYILLLLLLYNAYDYTHTHTHRYPLRLLHTSCARECKFTTRNVISSAPRLPGSTAPPRPAPPSRSRSSRPSWARYRTNTRGY